MSSYTDGTSDSAGGGAAGPAPIIDAVDDVADLRGIDTTAYTSQNAGNVIYLQGIGFFAWSDTSTANDNMATDKTVCQPTDKV